MLYRLGRWLRTALAPAKGLPFLQHNAHYRRYEIGDYSYGTPEILSWGEAATLRIGKYCSLAEGVVILLGGEHRADWISTYPFKDVFPEVSDHPGHPATKGDVNIGHDVWIGREAAILSGVSIGNGAIIGARSLVTKQVAPYTIVAGVPARPIRTRFRPEQITALLRIAWWDWPIEQVRERCRGLMSGQVDEFIAAYDRPDSSVLT
jgi:acetyltransferase-like isoleucine patch superfamily enzyme